MLYIRTDMNEQIATGHIMRCISIADALTVAGEAVTFILADEQAVDLLKRCNCFTYRMESYGKRTSCFKSRN